MTMAQSRSSRISLFASICIGAIIIISLLQIKTGNYDEQFQSIKKYYQQDILWNDTAFVMTHNSTTTKQVPQQRQQQQQQNNSTIHDDNKKSTFNLNSSSNSSSSSSSYLCGFHDVPTVRMHPKLFFENNGPGMSFLSDIEFHLQNKRLQRRYVEFPSKYHSLGCNRIYFHNHKAGGTTMAKMPHMKRFYIYEIAKYGPEGFEKKIKELIDNAYMQQQNQQTNHSVCLFTMIRDPVQRFLSGIQQILIINRQLRPCAKKAIGEDNIDDNNNNNENNHDVIINTTIINERTIQFVNCSLNKITTLGYYFDIHVTPQSYEIYDDMASNDLIVDIMDMSSSINSITRQLGSSSNENIKVSHGGFQANKFVNAFNFSISVLPKSMIEHICRIYHVDVLFISYINELYKQSLGNTDNAVLTKTICNDYQYDNQR